MRDPKRIREFCDRLATIWEKQCPDWRFGQLIYNVIADTVRDPFYVEDDKMIEIFESYFNTDEKEDKAR